MLPLRTAIVGPATRVEGRVQVPGDKSIAHRYALLAALAQGTSVIHNYAPGGDCQATRGCLEALGVEVGLRGTSLTVIGRAQRGMSSPSAPLDARNSGTTTRLLAGLLAAQPLSVTIDGDDSLRRRPMRRVVAPLTRMGAEFDTTEGHLPFTVHGGALVGIDFEPEVPSAQVKSAVLLAGLQADGITRVHECQPTRNHTELALRRFGALVSVMNGQIELRGGQRLEAIEAVVPGDLSSATFWAVAAAALPGSDVVIEGVGLNPTRTAVLDVLRRAGARIEFLASSPADGEPTGDIRVRHERLCPITIDPSEVPGLIDELPAMAALATHGGGLTVTGAGELRVKESDRISALVGGLRALGADVEEYPDGFQVRGTRRLTGGRVDACGDHRLAMSFAVAALGGSSRTEIAGADAAAVSYPAFFETLAALVR